MKRKGIEILFISVVMGILLVSVLFYYLILDEKENNLVKGIKEIETAGWESQSMTEVVKKVQYINENGDTIDYYICRTTYHTDTAKISDEWNREAVELIVPFNLIENGRKCKVNEWKAEIYEGIDRSYLCWTISQEISCILEYNPATVQEEDILRMAESVKTEKPK